MNEESESSKQEPLSEIKLGSVTNSQGRKIEVTAEDVVTVPMEWKALEFLRGSNIFSSDQTVLDFVSSVQELEPFRYHIPQSGSTQNRVDAVIGYLRSSTHDNGENVLEIFARNLPRMKDTEKE